MLGTEGRGGRLVRAREPQARPGSCEREARRRGLAGVCRLWGPARTPGRRGISGGWVSVGLLRGRRLQPPPPPVLAAALVSGGGQCPREAAEGKRLKVPRGTKVPWAGVELQTRTAQLGGKGRDAGPREVSVEAAAAVLPAPWRRRGCARVGSAEEEGEEQPARGAWGETKIRASSRGWSHPCVLVESRGGRNVGNPRNRWGEGNPGCQLLSPAQSLFSAFLCLMLLLPNPAG